jgi:DNA polymerase III delta subunit
LLDWDCLSVSTPRTFLLFNGDEYLVACRIDALRLQMLPEEDRAGVTARTLRNKPALLETISFGMSELDGARVRGPDILAEADVMPFLTPGRLVIVRGYFEQARKRMAPGGKKAADEGDAGSDETAAPAGEAASESRGRVLAELDALANALPKLPETTTLVFVDPALTVESKRGALAWPKYIQNFLEKGAVVDGSVAPKSEQEALSWLRDEAKSRGIRLSQAAAQKLVAHVGPELRTLVMEMEKLALYAANPETGEGREISEDDVRLLVSDAKEEAIWTLTDAMAARNAQLAFRTLADFWRDGDSPHMLLAGIINNYRTLLRSKAFADLPAAEKEELRRTRKDIWRLEKSLRTAGSYKYRQLADILERLLEANMAITTGADPEATLDVLIHELAGQP